MAEFKQEAKYYTRTPNILFEFYEDLHPQEKWLYINLVYLCGKEGTRHLSLRYISDRTGISIGALAGMIGNLHTSGLIHAEIKKRTGRNGKPQGQAQYHISIVDNWQKNLDFFTKRSEYEQSNSEGVQNMNTSVQNMNTLEQERSEYERERSFFDTNIRLHTKTTESTKTTEQDGIATSSEVDAPAANAPLDFKTESAKLRAITKEEIASHSQVDIGNDSQKGFENGHRSIDLRSIHGASDSNHIDTASGLNRLDHSQGVNDLEETVKMPAIPKQTILDPPAVAPSPGTEQATIARAASQPPLVERRGARKKKIEQPAFTLTAQEQAFWQLWCAVWFNAEIKPELNETAYKHIVKLAPFVTTQALLDSLIDYARKDLANSQGIKRKVVMLGNLVFCYAGWKQAQATQSTSTQYVNHELNMKKLEERKRLFYEKQGGMNVKHA